MRHILVITLLALLGSTGAHSAVHKYDCPAWGRMEAEAHFRGKRVSSHEFAKFAAQEARDCAKLERASQ